MELRDRYRGALLGLAVGDALGTTLEFKRPGTFQPVTDMVGGGPFGLKPGQWTDDTSMALCLAESLSSVGDSTRWISCPRASVRSPGCGTRLRSRRRSPRSLPAHSR
jgi:ADP-ribosylglycohydrolase